MSNLLDKIHQQNATAFTHSGKFHADDVFSAALLLYLNPEITIIRGNRVPEDFDGIVFDIGRGRYDHHQKDSRVRENGIPYAGFGTSMSRLGGGIGTRGPGEKKIETDRRLIRDRISRLNVQLKEIENHREIQRQKRSDSTISVAAIVGYTNAGKSTLLNKLKIGRAHV